MNLRPHTVGEFIPASETQASPSRKIMTMPEIGTSYTKTNANMDNRKVIKSFKTSSIARKLGQIAVANDLAFVPRMPDNAVVGITPDGNHSRESYVRIHHEAIDFARHLPKGNRPAFYSPDTHFLVPIQGEWRPKPDDFVPDLLDLELAANPVVARSTQIPSIMVSNTVDPAVDDFVSSSQSEASPAAAGQQTMPSQIPVRAHVRSLQKSTDPVQTETLFRIPSILRAAHRSPTPGQCYSPENASCGDHSELFYTPPPTFRTHPTYDVLEVPEQTQDLTSESPECDFKRLPKQAIRRPLRLRVSPPCPLEPSNKPAAWSSQGPERDGTLIGTATMKWNTIDLANNDRLPTPPLTFKDVETFKPSEIISDSPADLGRSLSQLKRKSMERKRRNTNVYRKKTSQELWEDEFAAEKQAAAEEERRREEERAEIKRIHEERLRAMEAQVKADQERLIRRKLVPTDQERLIRRKQVPIKSYTNPRPTFQSPNPVPPKST